MTKNQIKALNIARCEFSSGFAVPDDWVDFELTDKECKELSMIPVLTTEIIEYTLTTECFKKRFQTHPQAGA